MLLSEVSGGASVFFNRSHAVGGDYHMGIWIVEQGQESFLGAFAGIAGVCHKPIGPGFGSPVLSDFVLFISGVYGIFVWKTGFLRQ